MLHITTQDDQHNSSLAEHTQKILGFNILNTRVRNKCFNKTQNNKTTTQKPSIQHNSKAHTSNFSDELPAKN